MGNYRGYCIKSNQFFRNQYFIRQIRMTAGPILDHDECAEIATDHAEDLVMLSAIMGGFTRVFAEKLLLLDGKDLSNGGSIVQKGGKRKKDKDASD